MLRHFEIGQLRQDFQFELVRRPFSALLASELNPIFSRDFAYNIDVTRPAPRPFQVDDANNFSVSVSVLQSMYGPVRQILASNQLTAFMVRLVTTVATMGHAPLASTATLRQAISRSDPC
jgi:hypothetical protein